MKRSPAIPAVCFLLLLCSFSVLAQNGASKEVTTTKAVWFDFVETMKFKKKWTLQAEVGERFFIDPKSQYQTFIRLYGLFTVGENWSIGPVFSVWRINAGDISTYEIRPAQAFIYKQKFEKAKNLAIAHRYVVEERLIRNVAGGELADGYTFTMRFRYRFWADYTIAKIGAKENPLKVIVNDEIFLQAGESVVYNTFQQNRFYTGVSYQLVKGLTLAVGYLNQYAQKSSGSKYELTHVARISFQHELDFTKKD